MTLEITVCSDTQVAVTEFANASTLQAALLRQIYGVTYNKIDASLLLKSAEEYIKDSFERAFLTYGVTRPARITLNGLRENIDPLQYRGIQNEKLEFSFDIENYLREQYGPPKMRQTGLLHYLARKAARLGLDADFTQRTYELANLRKLECPIMGNFRGKVSETFLQNYYRLIRTYGIALIDTDAQIDGENFEISTFTQAQQMRYMELSLTESRIVTEFKQLELQLNGIMQPHECGKILHETILLSYLAQLQERPSQRPKQLGLVKTPNIETHVNFIQGISRMGCKEFYEEYARSCDYLQLEDVERLFSLKQIQTLIANDTLDYFSFENLRRLPTIAHGDLIARN
jgi:hypothetical protein